MKHFGSDNNKMLNRLNESMWFVVVTVFIYFIYTVNTVHWCWRSNKPYIS